MADETNIKDLKEELKKLSPKDRVKKLKELEEKRKQEINKIEELLKDSEKEAKTEEVAKEIVPEQTEVNIERLFKKEEEEALESTVRKEAPDKDDKNIQYMSFNQAQDDYSTLKDIGYATMSGPVTPAHMDAIDKIGERLEKIKYQSASKEIADILVASRATLYKIKKYAGLEKSNF